MNILKPKRLLRIYPRFYFIPDDTYCIDITTHADVDSWIHQNFIGYYDENNVMWGSIEHAEQNIDHTDAQNNPDWVVIVR